MERDTSTVSRTAQYMALFRALETVRAADDRMFADPFARAFLPGAWAAAVGLSRFRPLGRALERYIDAHVAGARSSGIARTKVIDDRVRDALAAGAEQLVLLGAGFDCRALRLPALAGVPVYEVDRGALLARKGERLARFGEATSAWRVPVPVDFLGDDLAEALKKAGFEAARRALLLCEGVTNYLDERAVGALFEFAGRTCAPGSRFLFTYVHADLLCGRFRVPGIGALFAKLDESRELWTFGFHPEELPPFCAKHGLRLVEDLGAAEYRALAMGERARGLSGYEFYRLATAEVGRA